VEQCGGRSKRGHMAGGGRVGMAIRVRVPDTRRVLDPTGTGMGVIFYLWVAPIPEPRRVFFPTRRVPDTLLPL
jgi:hypothetical protein